MGLFRNNGLWKKLTGYRSDRDLMDMEFEEVDWEEVEPRRREVKINMSDRELRRGFIQNCMDQIAEASKEMESLTMEYNTVTSHLKDMEEIEALPEEEKAELIAGAEKIQELEGKRGVYLGKKNRMSDEKFHQMDRMSEDAEVGCRKLKETEEYQNLIKQDMSRLEGEKHAYLYRKNELKGTIADTKGMAIISSVAMIVCLVILYVLRLMLDMDTQLGFLLTIGLAAVVILMLYLKYTDSVKELKRVEKGINRIIMLQNRVKIRYVNNTNLLEYLYMKYQVSSAKEFLTLWEKYTEEKEERKLYREAELELDECQQEFLNVLKCYQVKDPLIWLHQTAAILDNKEMVEIRHNLIIRRQSLRRRMDYNKEMIIDKARAEIKDMIERYPQHENEIRSMLGGQGEL